MAQFQMEFGDEFLDRLLNTDFDEIAEAALSEAAPVLEKSLREEVKKEIEHEGDSELADSFSASRPKKTRTDAWILNVTPKGYSSIKKYAAVNGRGQKTNRKYPVSNALKAIWKEHGIPGRQPPRPFIARATNKARNEVIRKIQEVYSRKVGMQ